MITMNNDLISRQAAIKAFNTNIDELVVSGKENADAVERYINRVLDAIMQLPPIQPKRGRWIGKYPVTSVCSECGFLIHDSKAKAFAYCPNCGAKMEVDDE